MILDAVRASGGRALAGKEGKILDWLRKSIGLEGLSFCPETAVCFDCLETLVASGEIKSHEDVVVFNTGAVQKYPEMVPLKLPELNKDRPIDYLALRELGT